MQLSRRSSERELSDGAKKRATSAGGLNRPDGEIKYVFVLFWYIVLLFHLFEFHVHNHTQKTQNIIFQ